jgi:hypothetical protein
LVPKLLPLAVVQKVLQSPLQERVSIRDFAKNTVLLIEYVQQPIRLQVVKRLLEPSGALSADVVDSDVNLSPQRVREIQERLMKCCNSREAPKVIGTASAARMTQKSFFANAIEGALRLARRVLWPDAMLVDSKRTEKEARHLGSPAAAEARFDVVAA